MLLSLESGFSQSHLILKLLEYGWSKSVNYEVTVVSGWPGYAFLKTPENIIFGPQKLFLHAYTMFTARNLIFIILKAKMLKML